MTETTKSCGMRKIRRRPAYFTNRIQFHTSVLCAAYSAADALAVKLAPGVSVNLANRLRCLTAM